MTTSLTLRQACALVIVDDLLTKAMAAMSDIRGYPTSDWWTERARILGQLQNELADEVGLRASFDGGTFRVRIAGLSASGTSGFEAALKNWQAAARRRIAS